MLGGSVPVSWRSCLMSYSTIRRPSCDRRQDSTVDSYCQEVGSIRREEGVLLGGRCRPFSRGRGVCFGEAASILREGRELGGARAEVAFGPSPSAPPHHPQIL